METSEFIANIDDLQSSDKRYFASCNTPQGFESYFGEIFSPEKLNKIYILKGGPGVGKSTAITHIGKEAEKRGFKPEYYHCSSSTASLDGIIIPELLTAVIDGTPPHCTDPIFPGVREMIVNMGECWNLEKLNENAQKILALITLKKQLYQKATHFLAARSSVEKDLFDSVKKALLKDKLASNARRIAERELTKSKKGKEQVRITSALCGNGIVTFHTFSNLAKNNYFINDIKHTAHLYFQELYNIAKQKEVEMIVSYSPEDTSQIDGICFPDKSTSFTILSQPIIENYDKNVKSYKIINMERFLDKTILKTKRQSYRFGEKCSEALLGGALEAFSEAKKVHDEIESIYIPSTDYTKVKKITDTLVKTIF